MSFAPVWQKMVEESTGFSDLPPQSKQGLQILCVGMYVAGVRAALEADTSEKKIALLLDIASMMKDYLLQETANEHPSAQH